MENTFKLKKNIDFLVIGGPTASGKTALSIKIAQKYNGEIINGDSVQVFKKLDIGSAKITEQEMENIPHHLINIKEPWEEYSVAEFQKNCQQKIAEIKAKGKLPIIVGGSGLYLNAIIYDYQLIKTEENLKLKEELNQLTNEELYQICAEECQINSIEIHINNRPRLLSYSYKIKMNQPLKEPKLTPKNCLIIAPKIQREEVYANINQRVDKMLRDGLIEEVQAFQANWFSQRSIGYKEVHQYIQGEYSYELMVDKIKQHTRNFAKRQMTWFKNQIEIQYVDPKNI